MSLGSVLLNWPRVVHWLLFLVFYYSTISPPLLGCFFCFFLKWKVTWDVDCGVWATKRWNNFWWLMKLWISKSREGSCANCMKQALFQLYLWWFLFSTVVIFKLFSFNSSSPLSFCVSVSISFTTQKMWISFQVNTSRNFYYFIVLQFWFSC